MLTSEQKKKIRDAMRDGSCAKIDEVIAELTAPCRKETSDVPVLHESQQRGDDKA